MKTDICLYSSSTSTLSGWLINEQPRYLHICMTFNPGDCNFGCYAAAGVQDLFSSLQLSFIEEPLELLRMADYLYEQCILSGILEIASAHDFSQFYHLNLKSTTIDAHYNDSLRPTERGPYDEQSL